MTLFNKFTVFGGLSLFGASAASAAMGGPVSPYAYELFEIPGLGLPVTNAMVTTWVISLGIILVIRLMVGKATLIPSKSQAVVEGMVDAIRGTIQPIVGKKMVGPTFPLLMGLFIFILMNNWSALLPGVSTFGFYDEAGQFKYFFRPANSDLNGTLALALVSFVAWLYYIFRYAGPKAIYKDLFGNKADKGEIAFPIYIFMTLIFFCVGIIEIVSIMFRPVSLSFRLFGNVFGGENLLSNMTGLVKYIVPVPFYFLEVLIGLIQAFVFTLLVAVYIGLICNHGDEEHDH